MNRFESMSVLVAVVDAGSFSAAARRLKMPLATVSRKVGELEEHFNARLIQRSTRKLVMTESGANYVETCRRILRQVAEAERAVTGEYDAPHGELVLTAPIIFGRTHVVPVVAEFLKSYPDINIRLLLSDRTIHLLEDEIDVAIRIGHLPDSEMVAKRVGSVRQVVCASPQYLKQHGVPKQPSDLIAHQCITFDMLASNSTWTFGKGKSETIVPIRSRLTVNTAEAAIAGAVASIGITRVLSYQIEGAQREGTLRTVLEDFEPAAWPVHLLHSGQGKLPLKLTAFMNFAGTRISARLVALK